MSGCQLKQFTVQREAQRWCYDLQIPAGQGIALMGPSGCGKSSLLEAIAGFIPHQGALWIADVDVSQQPAQKRPISYLFQQQNFFEHLTVATNLRLGFAQSRPTAEQWQELLSACEQLEVADLLDRRPAELSGGQQQRLALIRTLLRPQPLVLLDEPFSALDDQLRHTACQWVKAQLKRQQQSLILITHRAEEAEQLAPHRFSPKDFLHTHKNPSSSL